MIGLKSLYKFFQPPNWCQTDFVSENPRQIRLFSDTTFWCQSGANYVDNVSNNLNLIK